MTDNHQLSVTEASLLLGISRQAVLKAIKEGRLPAEKIGKQWVIEREDVDDYQPKGKSKGEQ